jgi:hypothetical protein
MLKQSQEQVLFAFEVGVNGTLASSGGGGDFVQLCALKTVTHKDFFRRVKEERLSFPCPNLLPTKSFHSAYPHLSIQYAFIVDIKLTSQYLINYATVYNCRSAFVDAEYDKNCQDHDSGHDHAARRWGRDCLGSVLAGI